MSAAATPLPSPVTSLARLAPGQVDDAVQLLNEQQLTKLCVMVETLDELERQARKEPPATTAQAHVANDQLGMVAKATKELELLRRSQLIPLEAEVQDLKVGLDAIEERARSEIGMIKRDEIFFQVVEPARKP